MNNPLQVWLINQPIYKVHLAMYYKAKNSLINAINDYHAHPEKIAWLNNPDNNWVKIWTDLKWLKYIGSDILPDHLSVDGIKLFSEIEKLPENKEVQTISHLGIWMICDSYLDFRIIRFFMSRDLYSKSGKKESNKLFFRMQKAFTEQSDYDPRFNSGSELSFYRAQLSASFEDMFKVVGVHNENFEEIKNLFLKALDTGSKKHRNNSFRNRMIAYLLDFIVTGDLGKDTKIRIMLPIIELICPEELPPFNPDQSYETEKVKKVQVVKSWIQRYKK